MGQPLLTPEFTAHGLETIIRSTAFHSQLAEELCEACIISANRWVFNIVNLHFTKNTQVQPG